MLTKDMIAELDSADRILVAFSGGKDSTAMLLLLLEAGYKPKLEIWHHLVDGIGEQFFDYPCTRAYVEKICQALDVPLYLSYKNGGLLGEITRNNAPTAAVTFQTSSGDYQTVGGKGKRNTQQRFPAISGNLRHRYCSSYVKIDVMNKGIRHQRRFEGATTVVVTGERAKESKARAKFAPVQLHSTDASQGRLHRKVIHVRPVLYADKAWVWNKLKEHSVVAHPAYHLSLGRCSCMLCIFLSKADLATIYAINPQAIERVAKMEINFGHTIYYDSKLSSQPTIKDRALAGTPHPFEPIWAQRAMSTKCDWSVIVPAKEWTLPPGAFRGQETSGSPFLLQ